MRRLRIQYSALGERWSIDDVERERATVEALEQGDVTIFMDSRGSVTSLIVDSRRPDPDALRIVATHFGREIVDLMSDESTDDIDRTIDAPDVVGGAVVRIEDSGRRETVVVIADEPGVPIPIGDGRFRVTLEFDVGSVDGFVDRDEEASRMRVAVDVSTGDDQLWVRVADGDTGSILALAPLRSESSDESATSDFVFGLTVPTQTLHFSLSDEPTRTTETRTVRRREWARRLEGRARAARWPFGARTRLYEKAAEIHRINGDSEDAERCRRAARRSRGRTRGWIFLGVIFAALAGFLAGRGRDRESVASVDAIPVVTEAPAVFVPVEPGPVDLVFDEGREAQVLVQGNVRVAPGEEIDIVVRARLVSDATFERFIDCVGAESGVSISSGDGPLYQPIFIPRLVNVSDPDVGSRAFAPFAVERAVDTYFVLPGECEAKAGPDGTPFDVEAVGVYSTYVETIRLPDDLEPGAWQVRLVLENVEGVSPTGDYVTIRVEQ